MLKKIKTREEIERSAKRKQLFVGGVLIFLLIISTAGYSFFSNPSASNEIKQKGAKFIQDNGLWTVNIDGKVYRFQYLPSEVEEIRSDAFVSVSDYTNKPLYIVNLLPGYAEIISNLGQYTLRYQEACMDGPSCDSDVPIKDCNENLIIFKEGSETKIYQDQDCIYIEGDSTKGADRFLYGLLGII